MLRDVPLFTGKLKEPQQKLILHPPGHAKHYPQGDEIASRLCVHCRRPIGYGRQFWFVTPNRDDVMHHQCWLESYRVGR